MNPRELLLVIDIGNTNTVLGLFKGERLAHHWRLRTSVDRTGDEYGILLRQLFEGADLLPRRVVGVILASVVPPMMRPMIAMIEGYLGLTPMVVGPGIRTHMPILYENPREVGADRIVNAVAGYEKHKRGLIICDLGTATTFDAVSPDGKYMGGVIAPGIGISAEALFRRASKLPRVEIAPPSRVIGRNTVESMQSGLLYGYVGMVNELIRRMSDEMDFDPYVMATGGLADVIAKETDLIKEVDKELTLRGLKLLWERNATGLGRP